MADQTPTSSPAATPGTSVSDKGVLTIGAADWAVNLFWSTDGGTASDAKAAAKREEGKHEFFCTREGAETPQFALGRKSAGHKLNMRSLASHLADSLEDNIIGMFKVSEGFYFILIRKGSVLAVSDRIYTDEELARQVFAEAYYDADEWHAVFVPGDWASDYDSEVLRSETLSDIINKTGGTKPVKLQALSNREMIVRGVAALVVLSGLFVGWSMWDDYQRRLEEAEQQRIAENLKKTTQVTPQQVEAPPPWADRPDQRSFIEGCSRATSFFLNMAVAGWNLQNVTCVGEQAVASYVKTNGTLNWLAHAVKQQLKNPVIQSNSQTDAKVVVNLPDLQRMEKDLKTYDVRQARKYLLGQLDEMFVKVTLNQNKHADAYMILNFSFNLSQDPSVVIPIFEPLPGLFMKSLQYDPKTSNWKIEGEVYEKLPVVQGGRRR